MKVIIMKTEDLLHDVLIGESEIKTLSKETQTAARRFNFHVYQALAIYQELEHGL